MRNRILKKEFWCDEKIIELTPVERLLFLGMTNFADDKGIQIYSAKGLKAKVFPADSISVGLIENGLTKMSKLGLIEFGNDNTLIRIKNWDLHQKINRPYPSKYTFVEEGNSDSMNIHGIVCDDSLPNNKNKKKNNNKNNNKDNTNFLVWYELYPRKAAKPKALSKFESISKVYRLDDIIKGTKRWCHYWNNAHIEKQFIPHPATFLNQEQFNDDPPELEVEVEYRLDPTGHYIGYCSQCKVSNFYKKEEIKQD